METLCGLFGKKRQWYYVKRRDMIGELQRRKVIIDYVEWYRMQAPRIGCVKLYGLLSAELGREVVRGRDSFLKVLADNGLVLPKKKVWHTTNSNHIYRKYPNLVEGFDAMYPNQVWFADITYVWIEGDVLYLHLVTDGYSHAVLGWCLSDTLEAIHTTEALKMTVRTAGGGNLCGTTHHSDRGVQYASDRYVSLLMEHHIRISMTERYNPTDNAVAERMNGILKDEWIYQRPIFKDRHEAEAEIGRMIDFYNNRRPHMSIGNKIPMDVYAGEVPGPNLWKKNKKDLQGNEK